MVLFLINSEIFCFEVFSHRILDHIGGGIVWDEIPMAKDNLSISMFLACRNLARKKLAHRI